MPSVTNSGGTIRIVNGSDIVHAPKAKVDIQTSGNNVRIQWEEDYFIEDNYTNFTAPTGASAVAVADAIAVFLDTGI